MPPDAPVITAVPLEFVLDIALPRSLELSASAVTCIDQTGLFKDSEILLNCPSASFSIKGRTCSRGIDEALCRFVLSWLGPARLARCPRSPQPVHSPRRCGEARHCSWPLE